MARMILVLLVALALAGCTSDDDPVDEGTQTDPGDPPDAGGNETEEPPEEIVRETVQVTITWSGVYGVNGEYDQDTVRVPANSTVELTFVNDDQNPAPLANNHDFVVEGIEGASTDIISPGEEATGTFAEDAATDTKFFCSVGNHRQNGMEGDFIVEA